MIALLNPVNTRFYSTPFVVFGAVVLYVGSYLLLSTLGRFEPSAVGLSGIKWYAWAPKGFVSEYKWNHALMTAYLPLYYVDENLWHQGGAVINSDYPVDVVAPEDMEKLNLAWGL